MKIAGARLRRIGGRLASAISIAGASWATREGLLLELLCEEGLVGKGEASPLPGYSPDTLEECEAALAELSGQTPGELTCEGPPAGQVRAWLAAHPLPPAARFAAETALFDLIAQHSKRPAAELFGSPVARHPVPLAALLPPGDLGPAASAALARGLTTLKIKIGRPGAFAGGFEGELAALQALRRELGPSIHLRLDANGAFPLSQATGHLKALAALKPEYVEEPVPLGQLAAFAELAPPAVPLAADESLRVPELRDKLRAAFGHGRIEVAVLKPTVLGGALACLDLVDELLPLGARFAVTHAFEGPVAMSAATALASVLPGPVLAAGLDRHPAVDALRAEAGSA